MNVDRRHGKFRICDQMIRCDPAEVMDLMGHVVVLRAEMVYTSNAIEYEAWSPLFEPVPEGCIIPRYEFYITHGGDLKVEKEKF